MAAAIAAVPALAPRPAASHAAPVWSLPNHLMAGPESRPALKQLQQTAPPNRSRRERPCDGCRKRKSKCVPQEHRRCVLCEFHEQACTFVENAQPRKRKSEDASRTSTNSDGPPAKKSPKTTNRPVTAASRSPDEVKMQPVASQPPARQPVSVDESLSLQRHRHCRYLGHTTALDLSLIGLGTFNDKNETESQIGTLRQVAPTEYFSTHADAEIPLPDDEARALAELDQVVGGNGSALIDVYFRYVHPVYPVIHKQSFLDRHRFEDRQFNPPLLAAIYLLALAWWDRDPVLSTQQKPDVSRLEYIAMTSLTMAMQRPKISAVQAGLLLLQRPKAGTWTLAVQLVALGQEIGLHLDCTNWSIPDWERRLRKRLAWALYMQDKWTALTNGRPSHITSSDWNVPAPVDADFDEPPPATPPTASSEDSEAEQDFLTRGRTTFIQMLHLTHIMAEVCDTFYSESAKALFLSAGNNSSPSATNLVLSRAKPVQIKLKDWFSRLPACTKMDAFVPDQPNPQGYLHLAYFATEIAIHRRIVQSLSPTSTSPSTRTSEPDPYLLYIIRSAAKTRLISALDFVNRLKPEHLESFWYFASASNFALIGTFGALLQATSPGREEAWFYACRLREFAWTLRVSQRKAGWIAEAVEVVEGNEQYLEAVKGRQGVTDGLEDVARDEMMDAVMGERLDVMEV